MSNSRPRTRIVVALAAGVIGATAATVVSAQRAQNAPTAHHPDLSGLWLPAQTLPTSGLKRQDAGKVTTADLDRSAFKRASVEVPGALPAMPAPSYKAEFEAKRKDLAAREAKTDPVFYCAKPGVPRIGPPRRIVQLQNEMIFLYEDVSGDPYRVIPTDGRPHDPDVEPSRYGHSVGHWEGDRLIVDVTSFTDDTWFGEQGYFHSTAMHVVERFWRVGENLAYQVTVEDPKVLTAPWTSPARLIKPSTLGLEESPPCRDQDAPLLLNDDHHDQR